MERVCAVLLSASLLLFADGVSINELSSPPTVKAGEELVLDCDFTYTEDEVNQLVVKWFFDGSLHPFYQWVPDLDMGPQIISPEFTDLVDLSYTVEGADQYSKFRALRIPSATLAMAGIYKCQVSSFTAEAVKETEVKVFAPPASMSVVTSSPATSDSVTISCMAAPAYPAPTLSLSWTQHLESHTSTTPATITEQDGMFSAMLNVSIDGDSVGKEDVVSCVLELPGTGYSRTEETEMVEEKIPEKFLVMFNKDNTEDATVRDDFIAPSDYDQEREEPMIALERSEQALEEETTPEPENQSSQIQSTAGLILLPLTVMGLHCS